VALERVCALDGVHLTSEGYSNVAKIICETVLKMQIGTLGKSAVLSRSAAVLLSGAEPHHYWKGFNSPVGSVKRSMNQSWGKFCKGEKKR